MPNEQIRILAAVMFTDMVGYTAMMNENEELAILKRERHREVLEELIQARKGKILQYFGDGTLAVFGSDIEAVHCALEIQRELKKEPAVPLRIGIHSGDIVYGDDGIYGDCVNIASRIENLCLPGGVLVSGKVYDDIKNHTELKAARLGEYYLKNVKEPIKLCTLVNEGIVIPEPDQIKAKRHDVQKSIAVLPFVNMSSDPENEYFSDGITEELLNSLAKVNNLKVTARTSSFAFKGKNLDIREIGEKLNVSTVLEGSVRKAGMKVRITAQLINIDDGYHLWSETFDRNIEDIFAVQDEVAATIANTLKAKLDIEVKKEEKSKEHIEAHKLAMKGKYYWQKWSPDNFQKAIKCFEEAIQLDPDYSIPYSWMAYAYSVIGAMAYESPEITFTKAKNSALKAIELDNNSVDAHVALALVNVFYDWDFTNAKKELDIAHELNPGDCGQHHVRTIYHLAQGEFDLGLESAKKAFELDPLALPINILLADAYAFLKHYNKAEEVLLNAIDLDPGFIKSYISLAHVYSLQGKHDKADEQIDKFLSVCNDDLKLKIYSGYYKAMAGKTEEANEILDMAEKAIAENQDAILYFETAILCAGLKEEEKMYYYLNKSVEIKYGGIIFIRAYFENTEYNDDPRMHEIYEKIRLR